MMNDFASNLPQSNKGEDLETISRNKLALLFDPALFEIRHEEKRDKGIDCIVEIKQNGYYTNFRFAIQLKSSHTPKANQDKSVSYSIETSNINYLLNYGMPAYYIVYNHSDGSFYISSAHDVFHTMAKKHDIKRKFPRNFSFRFSQLLNPEKIRKIYKNTWETGTLLRKLNPHIESFFSGKKLENGISIDRDSEIYSVEENISFVENFGFDLLNANQYKKVIEIEQRTHPRTHASPTFNYICGMAYFQQASLFKALDFLKQASRYLARFAKENQVMLSYTLLQAKYLIGIIEEEELKNEIEVLTEKEDIGSFLKIEKAYSSFLNREDRDTVPLQKLYGTIENILTEHPDNSGLRVMAYAKILNAEARVIISDLERNFLLLCGRVPDITRTHTYKKWALLDEKYTERLDSLIEFALKQNNFLAVSNLCMDKMQWAYWKIFHFHVFKNWEPSNFTVIKAIDSLSQNDLVNKSTAIEDLSKSYDMLGHRENQVACLSQKYELLHLAGEIEAANDTAQQILTLINDYEMNGLRSNHQNLIAEGTSHEKFLASYSNHLRKIYVIAKRSGIEKYMMDDIPDDYLEITDKNGKWSIECFMKFNL